MSQKIESWTHYNEWGEITHNAVLKCGQRELDLVKNYTGHDFDSVLSQYYAKARMYDAGDRRFTSVDPVKGNIGEPITLTQYIYVKNMPLVNVDPTGKYYIYKAADQLYYAVAEDYGTSFAQYIISQVPTIGGFANTALNAWEESGAVGSMSEDSIIKSILGNTYDELTDHALEIALF